jgi:hypothetical protein
MCRVRKWRFCKKRIVSALLFWSCCFVLQPEIRTVKFRSDPVAQKNRLQKRAMTIRLHLSHPRPSSTVFLSLLILALLLFVPPLPTSSPSNFLVVKPNTQYLKSPETVEYNHKIIKKTSRPQKKDFLLVLVLFVFLISFRAFHLYCPICRDLYKIWALNAIWHL